MVQNFKVNWLLRWSTDVPVVSIMGADASELSSLEENISVLSLECKADGNPKPYVWWTKNGQIIATNGPKLILAPVTRNHSGLFYLLYPYFVIRCYSFFFSYFVLLNLMFIFYWFVSIIILIEDFWCCRDIRLSSEKLSWDFWFS